MASPAPRLGAGEADVVGEAVEDGVDVAVAVLRAWQGMTRRFGRRCTRREPFTSAAAASTYLGVRLRCSLWAHWLSPRASTASVARVIPCQALQGEQSGDGERDVVLGFDAVIVGGGEVVEEQGDGELVVVIPRTGPLVLNMLERFNADSHQAALDRWARQGARACALRLAGGG